MTRLEAIRHVRKGQRLVFDFPESRYGVSSDLEVWINYQKVCDFSRRKMYQHFYIGPLHLRFWSGITPHWIHISPKQLLSFIKRNFPRK